MTYKAIRRLARRGALGRGWMPLLDWVEDGGGAMVPEFVEYLDGLERICRRADQTSAADALAYLDKGQAVLARAMAQLRASMD